MCRGEYRNRRVAGRHSGERAQTPEAGRRGTRGLGRGLVPVHFQPHRHWLTVLVIMHLACGIWKH